MNFELHTKIIAKIGWRNKIFPAILVNQMLAVFSNSHTQPIDPAPAYPFSIFNFDRTELQ